jgi:prepilin-type N-terminal cleavage/methylation domain-containing protein
MRIHHKQTRRSGFTLVEVLLTLLIMSGILLALTQLLTAARRSKDMIHNIKEHQLAGPAILDLIEADLRGLFVYNRTLVHHISIENDVMSGLDSDRIDFLTTTDNLALRLNDEDELATFDINEVGYCLRPNPSYDEFLEIYRREDASVDDAPFTDGVFQFLHDRVKGFNIKSYEEDGPDAEPVEQWGVEGSENIGLPAWIEIELTLELAPRLAREQILFVSRDRSTVTYHRVIRLPEGLRTEEGEIPMPGVPAAPTNSATDPVAASAGAAALGGGGGGGRPGQGQGQGAGGRPSGGNFGTTGNGGQKNP